MRKNYYHYVDVARLVSALAIILIHVTTAVLYMYGSVDKSSWLVAVFLNSAMRWGTPVFIMISGTLLLRSSSADNMWLFYKKRASKILIPLFFWCVFYFYLGVFLNKSDSSIDAFINLIWTGGTYYHLYFLFLIMGLYIITPFLRLGIKNNWDNKTKIVLFVSLLGGVVYTWLTSWGYLKESKNILWMFIPYIGYYLSGYYLSEVILKKKLIPYIWVLVELMVFITFLGALWLIPSYGYDSKGMFFLHRLNLNTMLIALIIFWKLTKINFEKLLNNKSENVIKFLASLSMGVYLIHPAVLEIFQKVSIFVTLKQDCPILWIGVAYVLTMVVSFGLVTVIRRIPVLNRVV